VSARASVQPATGIATGTLRPYLWELGPGAPPPRTAVPSANYFYVGLDAYDKVKEIQWRSVCCTPICYSLAKMSIVMSMMLLMSIVVQSNSLHKGGAACRSDHDCSLTGSCVAGLCRCDISWTGPSCERLHLLPAFSSAIYPPTDPHATNETSPVSPWGGAMHKDELTGLYHLFVTEYQNHCPMTYGSWTFQNSIRHATSASVNGPWVAKEMVLDGAGNPLLMKAPDGTYLLYFTGVPRPFSNKPPARNCNGANRTEWGPTLYCAHPANCGTGLHLAHSQSLDGPWEVELNIVDESIAGSTNPGGMVLPGGRVLLFYKGSAHYNFSSEVCPRKACRSIGVVSSPAWNAFPYKRFIDTGDSLDGGKMIGGGSVLEDPSNGYIDNVRGAVHMIFHQAIPSAPGGGTATPGERAPSAASAASADSVVEGEWAPSAASAASADSVVEGEWAPSAASAEECRQCSRG
jgi:hypothetical protein